MHTVLTWALLINTFIYFRKADGEEFEPCLMYDFSKVPSLKSGSVFSDALASRWKNLTTMKCEANPLAPENARFMYDQSEGLDTIVNDVRYGIVHKLSRQDFVCYFILVQGGFLNYVLLHF